MKNRTYPVKQLWINPQLWLGIVLFWTVPASVLEGRILDSFGLNEEAATFVLEDGRLIVRALNRESVEVLFKPEGKTVFPSYAVSKPEETVPLNFEGDGQSAFWLHAGGISVRVNKNPFRLAFYREGELLIREESGFTTGEGPVGFRFELPREGIWMGGGSRVPGMDRRGQRLPLYNKPCYGYETEADQMYYSLPVAISSEGFGLVFDNGARGWLDIGHTRRNRLEFSAEGGRSSYIVLASADWSGFMETFTDVTGRQPMPPLWSLGSFSSRMGYRSQAEVEWVVDGYAAKDIPLDAVVMDLFWFGPEIMGHMGRLDWDRTAFPDPEGMMQSLRERGIRTILITEPFVLTNTPHFPELAERGLLGTDAQGQPYTFDFYFGNTGLLDIFKDETRDWFWGIYRDFTRSGVGGWWGDLGEPEVHPDGLFHTLGASYEVHNLYGHEWARLVAEGYARDFPEERPLILMRAGFVGSQRYGIIPWSGDVNRSWGGLQSQVAIALQMSVQGLAYMHSDLGGFAGDNFDPELYTRWMQYGTFQPIHRPHAQEFVPPEPIFWDTETLDRIRPFIQLRYSMAPYNYTLAYLNSENGMPLMRPLFFEDNGQFLRTDAYYWGDAFLVFPVTEPGLEILEVELPENGAWFDFFSGRRHAPGETIQMDLSLETLPVFVRAGSWVPMIPLVSSLSRYPYERLILNYWHDSGVETSDGLLYEDDGLTPRDPGQKLGELTRLQAEWKEDSGMLRLKVERDGTLYEGRAARRSVDWVLHNVATMPVQVTSGSGIAIAFEWNPETRQLQFSTLWEGLHQSVDIHLR